MSSTAVGSTICAGCARPARRRRPQPQLRHFMVAGRQVHPAFWATRITPVPCRPGNRSAVTWPTSAVGPSRSAPGRCPVSETGRHEGADMTANTDVVVIGGGYAGVMAANHLRLRERRRHHAGQPAAEVRRADPAAPAGRRQPTTPPSTTARVLGEGIQLVVDSASAHRHRRSAPCALASGGAVDYDYLIYAVGSTGAAPTVPGAAEFAYPIAEFEHAQRLRAALSTLRPRRADHRGRRRADRHRDGRRARRAGPHGHAGLRRKCWGPTSASRAAVPSPSGWQSSASTVLEATVAAEVRQDAVVLADGAMLPSAVDHLDGRLRRAGAGRAQRAAHRRAGPAAHRRDADQRRRPAHRGRGRRGRTVGPAAADELPGRRSRWAPRPPTRC